MLLVSGLYPQRGTGAPALPTDLLTLRGRRVGVRPPSMCVGRLHPRTPGCGQQSPGLVAALCAGECDTLPCTQPPDWE